MLDSLLKNGANASVLDNAGKTALDFYIESSYDHSFEDDELWYLQFFVLILSPEAMRWFFNDEEGGKYNAYIQHYINSVYISRIDH